MSYKPEVQTGGDKWDGNALRFATEQEALENAHDLMNRWFAVTAVRVVPSDDPVNYAYVDHKLVSA
jgi:hypothetical protein